MNTQEVVINKINDQIERFVNTTNKMPQTIYIDLHNYKLLKGDHVYMRDGELSEKGQARFNGIKIFPVITDNREQQDPRFAEEHIEVV